MKSDRMANNLPRAPTQTGSGHRRDASGAGWARDHGKIHLRVSHRH